MADSRSPPPQPQQHHAIEHPDHDHRHHHHEHHHEGDPDVVDPQEFSLEKFRASAAAQEPISDSTVSKSLATKLFIERHYQSAAQDRRDRGERYCFLFFVRKLINQDVLP